MQVSLLIQNPKSKIQNKKGCQACEPNSFVPCDKINFQVPVKFGCRFSKNA